MDLERQLLDAPWVSWGGNSYVYEINSLIVVKVPVANDEERERFRLELEVLDILSRHPPCPYLVSCFFYCKEGIFLEYMRDNCLAMRIGYHCVRESGKPRVIRVDRLEPISLRKTWINDLAQGVAFLESLGLAHGDLRPENILFDRNRLKISDFDCTAKIGSIFEACCVPYGRLVGNEDPKQRNSAGLLGPRTEQFALGSLYYFINYGMEVYRDQCLGDDPTGKEHYVVVGDRLQNMVFPELNGEPMFDSIIKKCWYNGYNTIAALAADTKKLSVNDDLTLEGEIARATDSDRIAAETLCKNLAKCDALRKLGLQNPRQRKLRMTRSYVDWGLLRA